MEMTITRTMRTKKPPPADPMMIGKLELVPILLREDTSTVVSPGEADTMEVVIELTEVGMREISDVVTGAEVTIPEVCKLVVASPLVIGEVVISALVIGEVVIDAVVIGAVVRAPVVKDIVDNCWVVTCRPVVSLEVVILPVVNGGAFEDTVKLSNASVSFVICDW